MSVYLLHELLSARARRLPQQPAIIAAKETMSYAELDEKSSHLARALVAAGVRVGEPVGIAMHKCIDAIIGVYGIMKAGAAYVPIDAFAPAQRSAKIIANTQMRCLVTSSERIASLVTELRTHADAQSLALVMTPDLAGSELPAGLVASSWYGAPVTLALPAITDTHLAYILHTSGSTGAPKGVAITHRNALCFVEMAAAFWQVGEHDRLCSQAPLHFDLSVFDLYVAAHSAASIVLIPEYFAAFPKKMAQAIEQSSITIWNSVVSTLTLMMQRGKPEQTNFASLRALIFSGEVMPIQYLRSLHQHIPKARMYNVYGQTEANSSMVYEIDMDTIPSDPVWKIPLGKPFPNFEVFALAEDGTQITEPKTTGELFVRASSVASGYWNNPDLTSEKFGTDPRDPTSGAQVYRTGDLVHLDTNGDFIFAGRKDDMIKSRGYRVELGDIESALLSCPGVECAAAVAIPDDEIGHRLFAFATVTTGEPVDAAAILNHCRTRLPKYMLPEQLVVQADLPRTSTNKIDRNALRTFIIEGQLS